MLWEGEGQPLSDQPARLWSGLTDNYLRVMAMADESSDLHNKITNVHIDSVEGEILIGRLEM